MFFPTDIWRTVCSFADEDDLVHLWRALGEIDSVIVDEKIATIQSIPDPRQELKCYINYGYHCYFNSTHRCRHARAGSFSLSHKRKNSHDDVMCVTLRLCGLCYTYGMWTFVETKKKLPSIRVDGSTIRAFIQNFQCDRQAQAKWARDPRHSELVMTLPRCFRVDYYGRPPEYEAAREAFQSIVGGYQ